MKKAAKTMKKKKDWQTKALKRKHKEQDQGILEILFILNNEVIIVKVVIEGKRK